MTSTGRFQPPANLEYAQYSVLGGQNPSSPCSLDPRSHHPNYHYPPIPCTPSTSNTSRFPPPINTEPTRLGIGFGAKAPAPTRSLDPRLRLSSHYTSSIPYTSRTHPAYAFQPPCNIECIALDIHFWVSKPCPHSFFGSPPPPFNPLYTQHPIHIPHTPRI